MGPAVPTELARDTAPGTTNYCCWIRPLCRARASRETVKRSDVAGHARYGYGGRIRATFWDFRLYLIAAADESPIIWGLAKPQDREREVTRALFVRDRRLIHSGHLILGDKGFTGRDFEAFIRDDLGAHLLHLERRNETTCTANSPVCGNGLQPSSTR